MKISKWFFIILIFCSFAVYADEIESGKGKIVYVDFWASWCEPCAESFPWLDSIAKKWRNKNFKVVGINQEQDKNAAETFLKKHPVSFAIQYNPDGSLAKKYNVSGMPYAVLLNAKGEVVHTHIGFSSRKKSEYEAIIEKWIVGKEVK